MAKNSSPMTARPQQIERFHLQFGRVPARLQVGQLRRWGRSRLRSGGWRHLALFGAHQ